MVGATRLEASVETSLPSKSDQRIVDVIDAGFDLSVAFDEGDLVVGQTFTHPRARVDKVKVTISGSTRPPHVPGQRRTLSLGSTLPQLSWQEGFSGECEVVRETEPASPTPHRDLDPGNDHAEWPTD